MMCHFSCLHFGANNISKEEIEGKDILEVGSRNINGGFRELIMQYKPKSYLGIDIVQGPGVDQIADICKIKLISGSFDVVIMTETLEHIKDWRLAIYNVKRVLKPRGLLFLTTRSKRFRYHSPPDYWRFELEDIQAIFSDFELLICMKDPETPGVFLKARRPWQFTGYKNLSGHVVYNIQNEVIPSKRQ